MGTGMRVHEPAAAEYVPASHALHVVAPAVARAVCSERWQARSSTGAHTRQSRRRIIGRVRGMSRGRSRGEKEKEKR